MFLVQVRLVLVTENELFSGTKMESGTEVVWWCLGWCYVVNHYFLSLPVCLTLAQNGKEKKKVKVDLIPENEKNKSCFGFCRNGMAQYELWVSLLRKFGYWRTWSSIGTRSWEQFWSIEHMGWV